MNRGQDHSHWTPAPLEYAAMRRVSTILVLSIVIALIAAPTAFGKALQPPIPPEARSAPAAQTDSSANDAPAIVAAAGLGALAMAAAVAPLGRRRRAAAPS
jgi:hypothetical protein